MECWIAHRSTHISTVMVARTACLDITSTWIIRCVCTAQWVLPISHNSVAVFRIRRTRRSTLVRTLLKCMPTYSDPQKPSICSYLSIQYTFISLKDIHTYVNNMIQISFILTFAIFERGGLVLRSR